MLGLVVHENKAKQTQFTNWQSCAKGVTAMVYGDFE